MLNVVSRVTRAVIRVAVLLVVVGLSAPLNASEVLVLPNYTLKYSLKTNASEAAVWDLWQDVENWKKFDVLLEYSKLDPGQEFVTGATGVIKARGAGKTPFELIKVDPGVGFIEELKVPLYQTIELHRYFEKSTTGETIFSHEVRFRGRLRWLIYFAAASSFKKELPLVMGRLRELVEAHSNK